MCRLISAADRARTSSRSSDALTSSPICASVARTSAEISAPPFIAPSKAVAVVCVSSGFINSSYYSRPARTISAAGKAGGDLFISCFITRQLSLANFNDGAALCSAAILAALFPVTPASERNCTWRWSVSCLFPIVCAIFASQARYCKPNKKGAIRVRLGTANRRKSLR
jgi:hypothetical protein